MSNNVGGRSRLRRVGAAVAVAATLVSSGCVYLAGAVPASTSSGRPGTAEPTDCALPVADQAFERRSPAEFGFIPGWIDYALEGTQHPFTASIAIYHRNCYIAGGGSDTATPDARRPLFSVTKSIVSLGVGRAITLGKLGLDDPIGRYLPEADAAHGAITVRQLLTQTSGLRFAWANDLAASTEDSVDYTLGLPFVAEPGTKFEYAQTTVTLLAKVVERAVGEEFQHFMATQIFQKVGIPDSHWVWMRDGAGNTQGYAWLEMQPSDLARIGTLVLHDGVWDGERLISSAYLDGMSTPSPTNEGYAFLNRENAGSFSIESFGNRYNVGPELASAPKDTIMFSGFLDQDIFIVPSLDLVVVRMGLPMDQRWRWDLFDRLLKAIPGASATAADPTAGPPPPFEVNIDWNQIIDVELLIKRLATNANGR